MARKLHAAALHLQQGFGGYVCVCAYSTACSNSSVAAGLSGWLLPCLSHLTKPYCSNRGAGTCACSA